MEVVAYCPAILMLARLPCSIETHNDDSLDSQVLLVIQP
jgi:hypothetical protein